MDTFSRETETIRENKMEILETKNSYRDEELLGWAYQST